MHNFDGWVVTKEEHLYFPNQYLWHENNKRHIIENYGLKNKVICHHLEKTLKEDAALV